MANSVDQYVPRARQLLRWCVAQGILERAPPVYLLLPRPVQPTPALLNWEQVQTLLAAPDRATPLQLMAEADSALLQVVSLTEDSVLQLNLETATWTLLADYLERGRPVLAKDSLHHSEKALFSG